MSEEIKRPGDLVRLVSKVDVPLEENYNGSVYQIDPKEEKIITRVIAEHLVRRTATTFADGNNQLKRNYRLEIVELPEGQRQKSPGEFPDLVKENEKLKQENDKLKQQLEVSTGATDEQEEPRKRGRPKGS